MNKLLFILSISVFFTLQINGQNLFFFGENSYPCTEAISLQSNSSSNDLKVIFARDGSKALLIASIKPRDEVLIREKLIIYLEDGKVITCNDSGKNDFVDRIASSVYYLTNEQISILKNSNIITVRYTLKSSFGYSPEEGNYTATNKGTSTNE